MANSNKLVAAVLLVVALTISPRISAQSHHNYDPEQQDGIPVFSARSISRPARGGGGGGVDGDDWSSDSRAPAQRRQSDADLDDGMEEDDDDEYKSGSNPQESVDNPSYGESGRAARDGDEIEDFFDKHLGPPQEATTPDESAPGVSHHREVAAVDPDDSDHYEAAASSPLAAIFHSLLSHDHKHKRPFLQIGTADEPIASADEANKSSKEQTTMKTSQSAQSFVETAPIALAFTPLASMESSAAPADAQQDEHSAPVREIYIGRRPTVMSYLQQAHGAPPAGYATAGSSNVWRANGGRQQMVTYDQQQQQGDYARYPIAASYAHQQQAPSASSSAAVGDDEQTVTYGLSFGGGVGGGSAPAEEQPASGEQVDEHSAGPVDGEQQQQSGYVPYNTRYTTSSTRAHNNYYDNQTPVQYYRDRRPDYYQAQRLNQQQQQQMMYAPQQVYQQRYRPTGGSSSTRYHRDPSESAAAGQTRPQQYVAQYYRVTNEPQQAQDDNNGQQTREHSDEDFASSNPRRAQQLERQRLLADLNREIKASPIYQQRLAAGVAEAGSAPRAQMFATAAAGAATRPRHQLVAIRAVKKTFKGDDLDSYNSFHSEVDPYKSFTSTATMIDDPTQSAHYSDQLPQRASFQNDRHTAQRPSDVNVDQSQNQTGFWSAPHHGTPSRHENSQLATGPLINHDASKRNQNELLRNNNQVNPQVATSSVPTTNGEAVSQDQGVPNLRVRREDADEREIDNDNDDDGVWVDDDDDDDNRQQSSDVNETSQEPGSEEGEGDDGGEGSREDVATNNVPVGSAAPLMNPPGVIGGPHGYELSPNDLMVYHG